MPDHISTCADRRKRLGTCSQEQGLKLSAELPISFKGTNFIDVVLNYYSDTLFSPFSCYKGAELDCGIFVLNLAECLLICHRGYYP